MKRKCNESWVIYKSTFDCMGNNLLVITKELEKTICITNDFVNYKEISYKKRRKRENCYFLFCFTFSYLGFMNKQLVIYQMIKVSEDNLEHLSPVNWND